MNKDDLEIGDVIEFHSWEIGGFLFGIIIEHEDDLYHSKLNIWRPKDVYYLQSNGIDGITLINGEEDIKEYNLYDFRDLLREAVDNDIYFKLR